MQRESCPILVAAERLSRNVTGTDLPASWEPSEKSCEDEILAEVRHGFTNYEDLSTNCRCAWTNGTAEGVTGITRQTALAFCMRKLTTP